MLERIKYGMNKFVQFDVYVYDEDENDHAKHCNPEFLGIFSRVPHHGSVLVSCSFLQEFSCVGLSLSTFEGVFRSLYSP